MNANYDEIMKSFGNLDENDFMNEVKMKKPSKSKPKPPSNPAVGINRYYAKESNEFDFKSKPREFDVYKPRQFDESEEENFNMSNIKSDPCFDQQVLVRKDDAKNNNSRYMAGSEKKNYKKNESKEPDGDMTFQSFDQLMKNIESKQKSERNSIQKQRNEQAEESEWLKGFKWDEVVEIANKEIFGNQAFREKQREIINATKSKRDVIALIPTGGGKSLTFQLSSVTENGFTIVIMPLLSLINDQIIQMEELGISCKFLKSPNDIMEIFNMVQDREIKTKLLFVTPEKISQSNQVQSLLSELYISK